MDLNAWVMVAVVALCAVALIGFFATKTKGFGRFATSTLLLLVVVVISTVLYVGNRLDAQVLVNILFAVIGFAGGLFTGKDGEK